MEILNSLFENSSLPIWSAFLLGLMTAVSPCPLAMNITAIGYISKNIERQKMVFIKGLIYTLGRSITYTLIGLLFFFGVGQFGVESFFSTWGEKFIGPLLILIGLFMLGIINMSIPGLSTLQDKMEAKAQSGFWGVLLIGIVFALAFCPYSGALYFGMLIPMTIGSTSGLYLPIVFALATGIPVVIFAWILAYSVKSVGTIYNRVKAFETWFRRVVSVLFIGVGVYYCIVMFI